MAHNDDDIKIFHPSKKEGASADLAELALLMDNYRSNGNMEKAKKLGEKLADLSPEVICPEDASRLNTNEVRLLRALMVFSAQLSLHKYLPHQMLASQAINAMYNKIQKLHQGLFENISDGSSYTFYNLSVRKNKDVEENIGKNYAMLCGREKDDFYSLLGTRVYNLTDKAVCDMIEESEFKE